MPHILYSCICTAVQSAQYIFIFGEKQNYLYPKELSPFLSAVDNFIHWYWCCQYDKNYYSLYYYYYYITIFLIDSFDKQEGWNFLNRGIFYNSCSLPLLNWVIYQLFFEEVYIAKYNRHVSRHFSNQRAILHACSLSFT